MIGRHQWILSLALLLAVALGFTLVHARARAGEEAPIEIEMFSREGCPRCAAARTFLDALRRERPDVRIVIHEITRDAASRETLRRLTAEHGVAAAVPAFRIGDQFIIGFLSPETTGARIRAALDAAPATTAQGPAETGATCGTEAAPVCDSPGTETRVTTTPRPSDDAHSVVVPVFGRIDARSTGLPLFTLAIGLLDGFNPCAMWVLLLLLSLLVSLQSRARMLAVGGTFVLISGIVYFAFMAAWLNVFLLIGLSRAAQIALAAVAILVGAVNIKDFLAFKRGVSLSIPDTAKPGIYRRLRGIVQAEHLPGAVIGAAVLAILVNFIELLCTAGFPALYTRVLTLHQLPRWQYYAYIGLYNLAYVADDSLMLAIAVATLSRRKLQEREGRWLKLISGAVMLALGVLLLVRPNLLAGS